MKHTQRKKPALLTSYAMVQQLCTALQTQLDEANAFTARLEQQLAHTQRINRELMTQNALQKTLLARSIGADEITVNQLRVA